MSINDDDGSDGNLSIELTQKSYHTILRILTRDGNSDDWWQVGNMPLK